VTPLSQTPEPSSDSTSHALAVPSSQPQIQTEESSPAASPKDAPQEKTNVKGKHGGPRPNSGRPKGTRNFHKMVLELYAGDTGKSPLEVLTACYQTAYAEETKDPKRLNPVLLELAQKWARDAAPYVHARYLAQEIAGKAGAPLEFKHGGRVTMVYLPDNGRVVKPALTVVPKEAQAA